MPHRARETDADITETLEQDGNISHDTQVRLLLMANKVVLSCMIDLDDRFDKHLEKLEETTTNRKRWFLENIIAPAVSVFIALLFGYGYAKASGAAP